jgi:hypothetical protein
VARGRERPFARISDANERSGRREGDVEPGDDEEGEAEEAEDEDDDEEAVARSW